MRRAARALALWAALPSPALAAGGGLFSQPSAGAALADAVTGHAGGAGTLSDNPAGLADVVSPTLLVAAQIGHLDLWMRRAGERRRSVARNVTGLTLALAAPLPGPPWLSRLRIGADVYLPAGHLLRIRAPVRRDEPGFPLYGDRLEHVAATAGVGLALLPERLSLGAAVTVTPDLYAPTAGRYEPGRGEGPDDAVVLQIERDLRMRTALLVGVRAQLTSGVSAGAAWRQAVLCQAFGPNDTLAGAVSISDSVDFFEFWAPEEVAIGVSASPGSDLTVLADLVWARWSDFRTVANQPALPAWSDVLVPRAGVEWTPVPGLAVRGGASFSPTPVPEQTGETNLLDSDRVVVAAGLGLDLGRLGGPDVVLDLHLRHHRLLSRESVKDSAALPDADPELPGRQIDDLGFPSLAAGGGAWQAGVTLTLRRRGGEE